jgi:hypothetical protein
MDTKSLFMGASESLCFLISGDKGSIYYINENAKSARLNQMESGITRMLYNQEKGMLICITDNLMLGQYLIKSDSEIKNLITVCNYNKWKISIKNFRVLMLNHVQLFFNWQKSKVKLNGKLPEFDFAWIGNSMLAYATGENLLK